MKEVIINNENEGKRLDVFLTEILDESRSFILKNIKASNILVNDKSVKGVYLLKMNDKILIKDLTIDTSIKTGAEIPIEERSHEEVTHINGKRICAEGINVINPGFDVTPHELIAGIITEKGILRPDYNKSIAEAFLK